MADSVAPETGDGFLSRWSRRKQASRSGTAVEPDAPRTPPVEPAPVVSTAPIAPSAPVVQPLTPDSEAPAPPPAPTLAEAEALTPASDFRRFVGREVDPSVKNTALKKLFTDPHYNVMDGLDIYIDDYGRPDPIPPSMLRQMVQSRLLGLLTDEPATPPAPKSEQVLEPASEPAPELMAPAVNTDTAPPLPEGLHEDASLRLQPHDAAGCGSDRPCSEGDAGRLG